MWACLQYLVYQYLFVAGEPELIHGAFVGWSERCLGFWNQQSFAFFSHCLATDSLKGGSVLNVSHHADSYTWATIIATLNKVAVVSRSAVQIM